jgi:hypothetical protein
MPDHLLGIYRSENGPHGESTHWSDDDEPVDDDIDVALAKECLFNGEEIGRALDKEDHEDIATALHKS